MPFPCSLFNPCSYPYSYHCNDNTFCCTHHLHADPHERILADVHIRVRRRVRLHAAPGPPLPTAAALGAEVRSDGHLHRRRRRHLRLRHKVDQAARRRVHTGR